MLITDRKFTGAAVIANIKPPRKARKNVQHLICPFVLWVDKPFKEPLNLICHTVHCELMLHQNLEILLCFVIKKICFKITLAFITSLKIMP